MDSLSFGKYKGISISEVPYSYLKWLLKNSNDSDTLEIVIRELEVRDREGDLDAYL